jgi:phosphoribosylaminoimidazole-succinocarboxamide synthase
MAQALTGTNFTFPNQTAVYHGKVRDVYTIADKYMVMVASDRISAFDHILPKGIPYKGQVLNQIAAMFLQATQDIVPNWWLASPDPNVSVGLRCEPYKVEMVIRGYLAGHAAREYAAGKRILCGVPLPDGLKENDALPEPIITPTTKATEGHDMDISREAIIAGGIVLENEYLQLEHYTRSLFQRGSEMARERGLILVDTKYEFGKDANGTIRLIDEIHTPDSSRYFYLEGYQERQDRGEVQKQLSKEFVRQWLIANGFQGLEGQKMPEMPDEFVQTVTERYVELYERITGKRFEPSDTREIVNRVYSNTVDYTNQLIP